MNQTKMTTQQQILNQIDVIKAQQEMLLRFTKTRSVDELIALVHSETNRLQLESTKLNIELAAYLEKCEKDN